MTQFQNLVIFDSKRNTKEEKKLYEKLVTKFKSLIENCRGLRPIRFLIEDVLNPRFGRSTFHFL